MVADSALRKPANRPSRRQDLIEAAMELFSLQPWDFVTVADIVERAGMTPAAFYYHFSSREQLLEEVRTRDYDVFDRSIDVHIAALRKKLGDDAKEPRFIKTIRAVGYMLINPDA